jgi:gamma-butyrobetaine dioxygenase
VIEELTRLFAGPGAGEYLGEPVTIGVHMRQAGALAEAAGAAPALIAAALLHDVGHLRANADDKHSADDRHSQAGADWLARWFGPEVTEPVRLHVAAKRYLCAVEPDYFARLSAESVRTLAVQGGPMSPAEVAGFEALPRHGDAVRVRRWDDAAKDPGTEPPDFGYFSGLLTGLAVPTGLEGLVEPGGGTVR